MTNMRYAITYIKPEPNLSGHQDNGLRFQPNCIVKNLDIVGGVVEIKAGPEIGKVSGVCVHSNNLRQVRKTGHGAVTGRIA